MSKTLTLKPRTTEKTYALSTAFNTFVFDVPKTANKLEVAKAVEAQYSVKVKDVRIIINKGKEARSIRIGARVRANVSGKRSDIKKAYVTLAEGESLPIFAAIDEQVKAQEKAEAKQAEKAKAATAKSDEPKKAKLTSRLGRKKEEK